MLLQNAWLHHKGRNKRHWAYWMDDFSDGGRNILMPYKHWAEMICDFLGAGRAYIMGKTLLTKKNLNDGGKKKSKSVQ